MIKNSRRVVITGLGAVTPYGVGVDTYWDNISKGKSGIKYVTLIDTEKHAAKVAGEFSDFDPTQYLDPKESKRMDRYNQFAMVAADEAVSDAGITEDNVDHYRMGVIVGSAAGGLATIEKNHQAIIDRGPTKCSPFTVPMMIVDMGAGRIAIKHNAKGINKAVVTACATAAHSIGDGFRSIQWGEADVIIAGGAEAAICNIGLGSFSSAKTLSTRNVEPEKASCPYDIARDGFVMSEGSGILILEELEHAKARGAKIYAEIVGYGQTADAYDIVAPCPDGDGAARAMQLAINDAEINPEDVKYVNAHGTSTGLGDIGESLAVERVFGNHAKKGNGLLVSSTKSMTGHALGAAGAIEAIACIKTINTGIVCPTINLENQDERVADLDYVPNVPRETEVKYAMSNSFGFGGHNASLIFKKYE